ncbi:hypothetical protein SOVF_018640, partial [Spinacia oleracea]
MMAFLCKFVENPDILPRVMAERDRAKHLCGGSDEAPASPEKRRRLVMKSSSTSSSGMGHSYSEEDEDNNTFGAISRSHKNYEVDEFPHSPSSPYT